MHVDEVYGEEEVSTRQPDSRFAVREFKNEDMMSWKASFCV